MSEDEKIGARLAHERIDVLVRRVDALEAKCRDVSAAADVTEGTNALLDLAAKQKATVDAYRERALNQEREDKDDALDLAAMRMAAVDAYTASPSEGKWSVAEHGTWTLVIDGDGDYVAGPLRPVHQAHIVAWSPANALAILKLVNQGRSPQQSNELIREVNDWRDRFQKMKDLTSERGMKMVGIRAELDAALERERGWKSLRESDKANIAQVEANLGRAIAERDELAEQLKFVTHERDEARRAAADAAALRGEIELLHGRLVAAARPVR